MVDKSEAQLKNEREVQRILKERGYSSSQDQKKKPKQNQFPKTFLLIVTTVATIAIVVTIGLFVYKNYFSQDEQADNANYNEPSQTSQDFASFQNCLNSVDSTEIAIDDPDFWNKHISRYEQSMACYNQYPSLADEDEKNAIQSKIAELQEKSNQADATSAYYRQLELEYDQQYQEKLANNQAEYERKKAELEAETAKKLEEYDRQRDERNAQYEAEQAARAAKEAQCNSFKAEYPDLDTFKSKRGNLDELWNAYQTAKSAYESALRSWGSAASSGNKPKTTEAAEQLVNERKAAMDAAHTAWSTSYSNLSSTYYAEYNQACL